MPRTRRNHRFDFRNRRRHIEQRLKSARLPRALLLNQLQPGGFIEHVRREHEPLNRTRSRQLVERLCLDGERLRIISVADNLLIQRSGIERNALDRGDDHLVILTEMLPRQRPNLDTAAVLGEECRCFAGDVLAVDAPERETAVLHPFPRMAQIAELDALAAGCSRIVVVGRIEPCRAESVVRGDEALDIAAHRLSGSEAGNALFCALPVEFVGIGHDVPCLRRRFEEHPFAREWIEQSHGGSRGCD